MLKELRKITAIVLMLVMFVGIVSQSTSAKASEIEKITINGIEYTVTTELTDKTRTVTVADGVTEYSATYNFVDNALIVDGIIVDLNLNEPSPLYFESEKTSELMKGYYYY